MKNFLFLFLLFGHLNTFGQDIPIIHIDELQKMIESPSQDVQVFNFWATWCAPCVKELPFFEKLHNQQKPGVKVTLINLDFADKVDKVRSFVNRKKMTAPVFLLDEIDYNSWINKIDRSWKGAIPATLIVNNSTGKRKFVAKELGEEELQGMIAELQ